MKLVELELLNFRQFKGRQSLRFAGDKGDDAAVTVVHGFNGSGKTAILNAFTWCLYGETSEDFENPSELANLQAVRETSEGGTVEVEVTLQFAIGDDRYKATRRQKVAVESGGMSASNAQFVLSVTEGATGRTEVLDGNRSQPHIERMLPQRLNKFFFFNGERIERIASAEAYKDIEEDVKTLLQVEIYQRTVQHLRRLVAPQLDKELSDLVSDEDKGLFDKRKKVAEDLARETAAVAANEKEQAEGERQLELIEAKLRDLEGVKELQLKYDQVKKDIAREENDRNAVLVSLRDAVNRNAYLVYPSAVFSKTLELTDAARQRGDLPATVKPQFVQDLLDSHECICGARIDADSKEEAKLKTWMEKVGLADLEAEVASLSSLIGSSRSRRDDFLKEFERAQSTLDACNNQIRLLNDEKEGLRAKIGESEDKNVQRIEDERSRLEQDIGGAKAKVALAKQAIQQLEDDDRRLANQIAHVKAKTERGELLKKRVAAVRKVADCIQEIFDVRRDDAREALSALVAKMWKDLAIKDYEARVTDQFGLQLYRTVEGRPIAVTGASTGEKQVLALCFVAALVDRAKKNAKTNPIEGMKADGAYALVMDSPFGNLEDDYRRKVAEWIPRLANQTVILVSKTQWRREVEEAVEGKIGRQYVLVVHTPKEGADRTIDLRGQPRDYVVKSPSGEWTEIQEVK